MLLLRANNFKMVPHHCKYNLRKYYFTDKTVSVWNSLPNDVVMAYNINTFTKCFDKFSSSHDFVYLFWAQPLKTQFIWGLCWYIYRITIWPLPWHSMHYCIALHYIASFVQGVKAQNLQLEDHYQGEVFTIQAYLSHRYNLYVAISQ